MSNSQRTAATAVPYELLLLGLESEFFVLPKERVLALVMHLKTFFTKFIYPTYARSSASVSSPRLQYHSVSALYLWVYSLVQYTSYAMRNRMQHTYVERRYAVRQSLHRSKKKKVLAIIAFGSKKDINFSLLSTH